MYLFFSIKKTFCQKIHFVTRKISRNTAKMKLKQCFEDVDEGVKNSTNEGGKRCWLGDEFIELMLK